jgi:hypothetical protein
VIPAAAKATYFHRPAITAVSREDNIQTARKELGVRGLALLRLGIRSERKVDKCTVEAYQNIRKCMHTSLLTAKCITSNDPTNASAEEGRQKPGIRLV